MKNKMKNKDKIPHNWKSSKIQL